MKSERILISWGLVSENGRGPYLAGLELDDEIAEDQVRARRRSSERGQSGKGEQGVFAQAHLQTAFPADAKSLRIRRSGSWIWHIGESPFVTVIGSPWRTSTWK